MTRQQWGDLVRNAFPGYTGPRPPIQLWHGTADTLVPYQLLAEDIKQWTNVSGLGQTPTSTDTPQSGWIRQRFADSSGKVAVEAYTIQGAGHQLPEAGMAAYAIHFLGLDGSTPPTTTPPTTAPPTTRPPMTAPPTTGAPGGCRISDAVNAWNTGLTESITITNTGTSPVNGWQLAFTLPSGQPIISGWNAPYSSSGASVTATNASYNGTLAPGASVSIGFQATHTGNAAAATGFALNGGTCIVV